MEEEQEERLEEEEEEEEGLEEEEKEEEEEDIRDQTKEGQVGEGVLRFYFSLLWSPKLSKLKIICFGSGTILDGVLYQ